MTRMAAKRRSRGWAGAAQVLARWCRRGAQAAERVAGFGHGRGNSAQARRGGARARLFVREQ